MNHSTCVLVSSYCYKNSLLQTIPSHSPTLCYSIYIRMIFSNLYYINKYQPTKPWKEAMKGEDQPPTLFSEEEVAQLPCKAAIAATLMAFLHPRCSRLLPCARRWSLPCLHRSSAGRSRPASPPKLSTLLPALSTPSQMRWVV